MGIAGRRSTGGASCPWTSPTGPRKNGPPGRRPSPRIRSSRHSRTCSAMTMEDAVKPTYPRIRICLHTYVCICVFPYSGTYAHDYPVAPTSSSPSSSSSLLRSLATVCRSWSISSSFWAICALMPAGSSAGRYSSASRSATSRLCLGSTRW